MLNNPILIYIQLNMDKKKETKVSFTLMEKIYMCHEQNYSFRVM